MIPTMIFVIVLTILFGVYLFQDRPNHKYSASFGSTYEHLSWFNHGFAVSGSKSITRKASYENCAVFGPTGSGKSSVVIISSVVSLSRSGASIVINDVSGEVYERCSGYLQSKGYKILRLDFSNASQSEGFNPLISSCKSITDTQKIAQLIVLNASGQHTSDPFWQDSATMLIAFFIRYLVFYTEPEFRTLQNVLWLVERFGYDGKSIDHLIINTGDNLLAHAYKSFVSMPDKTLGSVISTARTALNIFSDPEVCKATATNSIDFKQLRAEKIALFVSNPLKDVHYFKPISALFFQSLFNAILGGKPLKDQRSIFILLEESATMKFPQLSLTVSQIRKYSAGILLSMQDEMALISGYGQAEAHQIKTNCGTQVYLKGQPLHTAKDLSQTFGKRTITDENGREHTRELMTADEIKITDKALILINNKPPLKVNAVQYYKNIFLARLLRLPPVPIQEHIQPDPPLIPFF